MFRFLTDLPLGAKVSLLGAGSALVAALALVGLATWQSGEYNALAQGEVDALINADLDHIARGVYTLVQTEDQTVQQQVDHNLNVARHVLAGAGGVELGPATTTWTARNQFTGESAEMQLPQMLVGGQWLGQNSDPAIATRVVDNVAELVGETATIFQRMNADGDMLRVATTVQTSDGQRAIGTYIPAREPQGTANPVIAAVLDGGTYHGRAYVVNEWYLTAYEPITDNAGDTVGMLYVGVKQATVEARVRQAILQTRVGKTGYLYVLGSQGERRGHYIISQRGERDGEDIWENRDSDGQYVIQAIIAKASALAPGELATERYRWQNPGEPAPRWKVARLAYYAPWDWVIGTSVYEDELQTYRAILDVGRVRMTGVMVVAGLGITLLIGLIGVLAARTIVRPVRQMTRAAETITRGDLSQVVDVRSGDEIGTLATTFNFMTRELRQTLESLHKVRQELEQRLQDLRASEQKYRQIVETSQEGIIALDEDDRIVFLNPHMAELLGDPAEELLGRSVSEFMVPEELADHAQQMQRRRAGQAGRYERRFRHRSGRVIVAQISAPPMFDDAGRFRGAFAMLTDVTDRNRAEAELRRSRNMLAHVLNSIPQSVFWKDRDFAYLGCNDVFARAVGLADPAEIIGKTDLDLPWPRAEAEAYRADDREVMARGCPKRHILEPLQQADGVRLWVDTTKVPLCDESGAVYGVLGVYEDVTERKRAENALRESEDRLRTLINAMPDIVCFKDGQGRWVEANEFDLRLFQLEHVDYRGKKDAELAAYSDFYREAFLTCADLDEVAWRAGCTVRGDETIPRPDGPPRVFDILKVPTFNPDGTRRGLIVVGRDITERKRVEEELRESERALSTLMSNLPGMAYRCRNDQQWTMVLVSDGCAELTGYPAEALTNNRAICYEDLIHPDDRANVRDAVEAALTRRVPFELTYRIRAAAGAERWVWERGRGVYENDELLFLEGFVLDVTERRRAEDERDKLETQLRQAQKLEAVGQLAGGVAHDFNNILTAIFGNVEVAISELERQPPGARDAIDGMRQIERSAQRAAQLTRQLLAFSRRQVTRPEVLSIHAALRDLEKMLRRLITEDIELQFYSDPDLQPVKVDPGQLEQVIVNLVVNARDAMPDGGRLTLETRNVVLDETYVATHSEAQVGPHVLLAVSDTGCGIDPTTLERIFEPFFTTKAAGQGTGLGLATVYGIVRQTGGSVAVYSELGRGTTFRIYLPVSPETVAPQTREADIGPLPTGAETLLICEDDPAVRELTAFILKQAGYTVLVAAHPQEALQLAATTGPLHLLITDVIMPEMNGRRLADELARSRPGVRTLFVSGYPANAIAHHGVLDDGVEFLEKPYSRRQLLQRVREVLQGIQREKA